MKYIALVIFGVLFAVVVGISIDNSIKSQDEMLCNSAKVSGNTEYLGMCECFYAGEDIRCIYGE